ncbi:MAG: SDR family oxidoreductase [Gammaproteobacteria bacterium]|nr:SDR family oxidoreductase [Gammaproteobacteria bacterium]
MTSKYATNRLHATEDTVNTSAVPVPRKTVLVTGGTRGIGRAIVTKLVNDGWNVGFTYRSEASVADLFLETLRKGAADPQQRIQAFAVDLASDESVRGLPAQVEAHFGRLDALVNNAGLTDDGAFLTMDASRWQRVLNANFGGTARLTLAALPALLRQSDPSVVVVASLAGISGKEGQVSYATSKGALVGFTQWLGRRYGEQGLRVNAIAPGFIRTEMVNVLEPEMYDHILAATALKRMGEVEEVAAAVAFLLSPGYLQGSTLRIDGGFKR